MDAGTPNRQMGKFRTISLFSTSIDLSTPPPRPPSNCHFTPQTEKSDYPGNGKRTFELGPFVAISCHPWDSNVKLISYFSSFTHFSSHNNTNFLFSPIEPNLQNPPQQDTPVPHMPCDELTLPLFVEPSQCDEPPMPGPSPSSKPHEDVSARGPKSEVAPTQSSEEPFACPATPRSVIIIENFPVGSPAS
ncbi:hypothetical protein O181_010143 [Austropuccinia psidii MF-1]|uniref:Uncharacterized protein n=1 Tax=Austropuccinia psidii MF-1 TaxID=1389203 RepID=A0A9Q3BSR5_9BASI|nr:hypothetical protein [Austropuccinia psidii MF-1]